MLSVIALTLSAGAPLLLLPFKVVRYKLAFFIIFVTVLGKTYLTILFPIIFTYDKLSTSLFYYYDLLAVYFLLLDVFLIFNIVSGGNVVSKFRPMGNRYHISTIVWILGILCFSVLVIHSNFVFLTNPRDGYQYYREGVGVFWVFYITLTSVVYYFVCFRRKITLIKILAFSVMYYFTGSKQMVLISIMISMVVFISQKGKIGLGKVLLFGVLAIALFLVLFDQFGAKQDLFVRLISYFDYLTNAERVFDDYRSGTLEFQNGKIFLSSFWSFVPRGLFPDKPFAYGATYVLEMYYPGLAATGHTPSFGPLTTEFVDFGALAPLVLFLTDYETLIRLLGLALVAKGDFNPRSRMSQVALIYILAPGFGFHLPSILSFTLAYLVIPRLTTKRILNA